MYRIGVGPKSAFAALLTAVLLLAGTAGAQVQVGDNISMTLNGSVGLGYDGNFGNYATSSHGIGAGANANLDGYYYHPNFLSFDLRPYYGRSSSNSDSQSITRSTGFGSGISLFGGSHFPTSISYGMDFSSNSEFYVAGVPSVVGDSSGHHFGFNWAELLPGLPHVYVNFDSTNSNSTLAGTSDHTQSAYKALNINSDYRLAGWDLRGYINHNNSNFVSPDFLIGQDVSFSGSGTYYSATAQHAIPRGTLGLGWSHSSYDNEQGGGGSGNNYNETVILNPFTKLSVSQTLDYTTNATAALSQSILNGVLPIQLSKSNDGFLFRTNAVFTIGRGLAVTGYFNHRRSSFSGQDYSSDQYGGSVNFTRQNRFLGFINTSVGFVDTASQDGNNGAGLVGTVGMNKRFGHWETAADFNYFQSVQTLYFVSNLSSMGYGATVRRKINPQLHWSFTFHGTHSVLSPVDGNSNKSEAYTTNVAWKRFNVAGNYTRSDGLSVLSSNGTLVATQLGGLISDYLYVFNAKNWGVNGSTRLFRRLTVSGGFSKFKSNSLTGTIAGNVGVLASGDRYFARFDYRLRRFSLEGGYSRVGQDVSTIVGGPRVINSYFITFSRWFNVF
jgi:hypothetical protein